jgi:hypothetical protein
MKGILIVGGFALIMVLGLTLYANTVLNEAQRRTNELERDFRESAAVLRGLDERFPYRARDTLDPKRYADYLQVRSAVALSYRRTKEQESAFEARRRRNEALVVLAQELESRSMGLAEYRAVTLRWQAVLARGEQPRLLQVWNATAGLGGALLPRPATSATKAERELLARHARAIEESLAADVLGPTLDEIAGGA